MSRLAIGTAQFGLDYGISNQKGFMSFAEIKKILHFAKNHRIDTLDTAISYGDSEKRIGSLSHNQFNIITKLPKLPINNVDINCWVYENIKKSLLSLNSHNLYGVLLHNPSDLLGAKGPNIFQALQDLKNTGIVSKVGVSVYSPLELDLLCKNFQFDIVQIPFSLFDQRMLKSGWMQSLYAMNVEIHTRSVFLQGLPLMNYCDLPDKFLRWKDLWGSWYAWLEDNSISALDACLSFVLNCPYIDKIIVGVINLKQLEQIISIENGPKKISPPDFLNNLDELLINPFNWSLL